MVRLAVSCPSRKRRWSWAVSSCIFCSTDIPSLVMRSDSSRASREWLAADWGTVTGEPEVAGTGWGDTAGAGAAAAGAGFGRLAAGRWGFGLA